MNFNDYKIPKEYTDKFKVTKKDLKDFERFWVDELIALREIPNLSKEDIKELHLIFMECFWESKASAKEKYTPRKYKNNIYINKD